MRSLGWPSTPSGTSKGRRNVTPQIRLSQAIHFRFGGHPINSIQINIAIS